MIARKLISRGGILLGVLLVLCQGCEIKRPATCTSSSSGDPDYVEITCREDGEETKMIREGDKVTYYRNGVEVESLSQPED